LLNAVGIAPGVAGDDKLPRITRSAFLVLRSP